MSSNCGCLRLRERPEDVPELAEAMLRRLGRRMKITPPMLGKDALAALEVYAFPGNVRELENILERAITLSTGGEVSAATFNSGRPGRTRPSPPIPKRGRLGDHLEDIERDAIRKALEQTRYNKTAAAKVWGCRFGRCGTGSRSWVSNRTFVTQGTKGIACDYVIVTMGLSASCVEI